MMQVSPARGVSVSRIAEPPFAEAGTDGWVAARVRVAARRFDVPLPLIVAVCVAPPPPMSSPATSRFMTAYRASLEARA